MGVTIDAIRARGWRAYADVRRVLSGTGARRRTLAEMELPSRRDQTAWMRATREAHVAYRLANPVPSGRVAIVCVSRRPHLVDRVVDNIAHQTLAGPLDVVFVQNSEGFGDVETEATLAASLRGPGRTVTVLDRPSPTSLGACLNAAMAATDARFVAKFDDDDLYGPDYLADALRAHGYAGAAVVGKHTYYAYLEPDDRTVLRFPGAELRSSGTLAGGTLVIDRERAPDLAFPDVSLGEDRGLLAASHRAGLSTFSADRFNFVQVRSVDNTWQIDPARFLERTIPIGPGLRRDESDR